MKNQNVLIDKYVTAHHGIIPTGSGNFDEFSQEEKNIYKLIAERYFIQFLEKVKVEKKAQQKF